MTQENTTETATGTEEGSSTLFNTAAGWVLFAAGLGLGLSIVADKYFHGYDPERPEQLGYPIAGVVEEGAAAEVTMAEALNMEGVDAAAGERVFAKCQACHSIEQGGANGVGPNLYGIMGAQVAAVPGFAYSSAMSSHGGQWGWEEMNAWLANPRGYINGTKMSFAGLSSIEDRAAVALYMNSFGSGLAVPEFTAPADDAAAEDGAVDDMAAEEPTAEGTAEEVEDAIEESAN